MVLPPPPGFGRRRHHGNDNRSWFGRAGVIEPGRAQPLRLEEVLFTFKNISLAGTDASREVLAVEEPHEDSNKAKSQQVERSTGLIIEGQPGSFGPQELTQDSSGTQETENPTEVDLNWSGRTPHLSDSIQYGRRLRPAGGKLVFETDSAYGCPGRNAI